MSALNSAIQRSRDDAQTQFNQTQNLVNEQQRNIANERVERFDIRNRLERLLDREDRLEQQDIENESRGLSNQRARLDLAELENRNQFNSAQRNILTANNATPADNAVRSSQEAQRAIDLGVTPTDRAVQDRQNQQRLAEVGQDPTSQAIRQGQLAEEQNTIRSEQQQRELDTQRSNDANIETANREIENTLNLQRGGVLDLENEDSSTLRGALEVIQTSSRAQDPDVIRLRSEIQGVLGQRESANENTQNGQEGSNLVGLRAELEQLRSIQEPSATIQRRIAALTGEIEQLQSNRTDNATDGSDISALFQRLSQ